MKNATLSNALRYSLFVQIALVMTGLFLYCLPNNVGQNFVVLLAPFVAGAPVAGSILQFLPNSNFVTSLPVMMGLGLLTNFIVYAGVIYFGLRLREGILKMPLLTTT
jgi:hypothetical protein